VIRISVIVLHSRQRSPHLDCAPHKGKCQGTLAPWKSSLTIRQRLHRLYSDHFRHISLLLSILRQLHCCSHTHTHTHTHTRQILGPGALPRHFHRPATPTSCASRFTDKNACLSADVSTEALDREAQSRTDATLALPTIDSQARPPSSACC
jgi:hypothetical protein